LTIVLFSSTIIQTLGIVAPKII